MQIPSKYPLLFGVIFLALIILDSTTGQILSKLQSSIDIFDTSKIITSKTTVSSLGPDVSRAKKYVYIAGASYCSDLAKWDCEYCKKSQSLGYEYSSTISNSGANTLALVVISKSAKEIVVAFRGTSSVGNVLQDAVLTQTDVDGKTSKGKSSKVKVHNGFMKATKSLYPQVVKSLTALLKKNKGYSVVITGHSLGAAMASITLYMLRQRMQVPFTFPKRVSYSLFGYGGPRTGNQPYADYWNSQKIQVTRVVSKGDCVPHVPPGLLNYVHHGTELWIMPTNVIKSCSKQIYEDPTCSNSLGPVFSVPDHLQYWDVAMTCSIANPITIVQKFTVPVG